LCKTEHDETWYHISGLLGSAEFCIRFTKFRQLRLGVLTQLLFFTQLTDAPLIVLNSFCTENTSIVAAAAAAATVCLSVPEVVSHCAAAGVSL